ncbi:MAG: hypothetical protein IJJ15_06650 [Ruminococcus sp.]|nr:hypothetical protein [Ruminococcus sp.]
MNPDFHYYATYCAAILAGYSHEESLNIAYSDQFVDLCSETLLNKLKAPSAAATTQLQLELMDARTDIIGLQKITRIWSSFHFLPRDLGAVLPKRCSKRYLNKYRLICGPNGELVKSTVKLAKGKGSQAVGVAMHVLSDTWAHRYFAGTPSLVINNTNPLFFELFPDGTEKKITFRHSATLPDDLENSRYTSSLFVSDENSIMNLGHGRAGHLPDYSFIRYKYLPAWGNFEEIVKDNPSDYRHAFCQMITALKYLKDADGDFSCDQYDFDAITDIEDELNMILTKRQTDASADWKALGEKLSGCEIESFDLNKYQEEYINASEDEKDATYLGRFILAALAQKSMVTNRIYSTGNKLAGDSVDYNGKGFKGIKAYRKLVKEEKV